MTSVNNFEPDETMSSGSIQYRGESSDLSYPTSVCSVLTLRLEAFPKNAAWTAICTMICASTRSESCKNKTKHWRKRQPSQSTSGLEEPVSGSEEETAIPINLSFEGTSQQSANLRQCPYRMKSNRHTKRENIGAVRRMF